MSNKTQLQTNNTNLDALITRVNAAKDTAASLPDAGNGSGSGASFTQGIFTLEDNGMYEPGLNQYVAHATDLNLSSRNAVHITSVGPSGSIRGIALSLLRIGTNNQFEALTGLHDADLTISTLSLVMDENTITFLGNVKQDTSVGFIAI